MTPFGVEARDLLVRSFLRGSSHKHEVRVDDFDVHPTYATISSPECDPDPEARLVTLCETSHEERAAETSAERLEVTGHDGYEEMRQGLLRGN